MNEFWLGMEKILASPSATPIVVAILGWLLLRKIESVKAEVAKQSDFHQKWAGQFFACCQKFMQAIEKELAVLTAYGDLKNPNDEYKTELQKEIAQLHTALIELELRIKRSVAFAPKTGGEAKKAASECMALLRELIAAWNNSKGGNVDVIIGKMNEFNVASRKAHEEMLELSSKRTWLGRIRSMFLSKQ